MTRPTIFLPAGVLLALALQGCGLGSASTPNRVDQPSVDASPAPAVAAKATPASSGKAGAQSRGPAEDRTPAAGTGDSSPGATVGVNDVPKGKPFILLRAQELTPDATLNFIGQGFQAQEKLAVRIDDPRGATEADLESVRADKDGNINEVALKLPAQLPPGEHIVQVAGDKSGRSAQASFGLRWLTPKVTLDPYTAKPEHPFRVTGAGFAPDEDVELRLGGLGGSPLDTLRADHQGNLTGQEVKVPFVPAGDYPLYFVGRRSENPVSVGFNVQGFTPFVILDNYAPLPYYRMGLKGEDFAAREDVEVYIDKKDAEPVVRLQADDLGRIDIKQAFEVPALKGEHSLLLVGERTGANLKASFSMQPFAPSLELTAYAGRPGTHVGFTGTGWARSETLRAFLGDKRQDVGAFSSDATGAFRAAGTFTLPIGTAAGNVPLTVVGDVSQATATVYFEVLELKPSAELNAYKGPAGTVVSFTGRGFVGGERVSVHLKEASGPVLAEAKANDEGTFEGIGRYVAEGSPGDEATPFVMVGADSNAKATTHFLITSP